MCPADRSEMRVRTELPRLSKVELFAQPSPHEVSRGGRTRDCRAGLPGRRHAALIGAGGTHGPASQADVTVLAGAEAGPCGARRPTWAFVLRTGAARRGENPVYKDPTHQPFERRSARRTAGIFSVQIRVGQSANASEWELPTELRVADLFPLNRCRKTYGVRLRLSFTWNITLADAYADVMRSGE